ncbi:SPOR domain-containing protein [Candidatus Pandoraea novymonadis]|uniref:SPOR domain-containing protein n=1 Tax=Candidatus Pandoraea novymonadis TaxID=1808959 RepID=A0ABX5FGH1_9BURK|nr:SPOR domain-containing protein [Candidatus Pandoraea novymonadis]PSB92197.1 hypothetical protein BZL35_00432 [Candidatus Pandoraea novymonadis]
MGLFSFFRKYNAEKSPTRDPVGRGRSRLSERAVGGEHAQSDLLFPEKQRARRRFVGALALVFSTVIVLPMVLEPDPKPATEDDIVIRIRTKDTTLSARSDLKALQQDIDNEEKGVTDLWNASQDITNTVSPKQDIHNLPSLESANLDNAPSAKEPVQTSLSSAMAQTSSAKLASKLLEKKHDVGSTSPHKRPTKDHCQIQIRIGAFASEERANAWLIKLKLVNVPSYMEKKKVGDRELYLLRAGPFSDTRNAAWAAKKVRDIGLSAQIVEG